MYYFYCSLFRNFAFKGIFKPADAFLLFYKTVQRYELFTKSRKNLSNLNRKGALLQLNDVNFEPKYDKSDDKA